MTSKKQLSARAVSDFRKTVWTHYRKHGRHTLPWRITKNPYRILISEVMLQQTQVDRVVPYYRAWMRKFPTVHSLASASLKDALHLWQGLGYNRRAKMLHACAKVLQEKYRGEIPRDVETLVSLPGVGPYTARAVLAFAYNIDVVCIETNIRTVFTHHFFSGKKTVDDREILRLIEKTLPKGRAREWYSALMDYGSFLKQQGVRTNSRVKGYRAPKPFAGSNRQVRGAIVRTLLSGPLSARALLHNIPSAEKAQVRTQLEVLVREGLIEKHRAKYQLPS